MARLNILLLTGLVMLMLALTTSCKKSTDKYEISGKLENVEGGYFYMSHEVGDSVFIDTIPINGKGEFSFMGKVDTLTLMSLRFNENRKHGFVFVDKGWNVNLKGNVLYPDLINVKGGNVNDDLTEFKNDNEVLLKSRADILNSAENANLDNDTLPIKDYVVELKNINFELSNVAYEYVKANPEKIASVMLINTFFKDETSIPRLEESLTMLKGRAADFPLVYDLTTFKDKVKRSAVGAYAPFFSLKNTNDKKVQLSDFRGKYILLSFVATTCQVCHDEKKDAIDMYNELKKEKKDIEFVTVVKDIELKPLTKGLMDSVKWEVLPVNGGWSANIFDQYYVREIPYHILISPKGYILERDINLLALPQKLEEHLSAEEKKN